MFEKCSNQFKEVLWKGIYRDNGLLLFKGKKSLSEIKRWREDFQIRVHKIAGNQYLQFTCKIWMPNTSSSRYKQDYVSEIAIITFPYLDLEFLWNADGQLEYQVNQKPNKKLKYLNKRSTHTNAMFNAIPSGIFYRLAKLTSRMKKNAQMKIDERYQGVSDVIADKNVVTKIMNNSTGLQRIELNGFAKRHWQTGYYPFAYGWCLCLC